MTCGCGDPHQHVIGQCPRAVATEYQTDPDFRIPARFEARRVEAPPRLPPIVRERPAEPEDKVPSSAKFFLTIPGTRAFYARGYPPLSKPQGECRKCGELVKRKTDDTGWYLHGPRADRCQGSVDPTDRQEPMETFRVVLPGRFVLLYENHRFACAYVVTDGVLVSVNVSELREIVKCRLHGNASSPGSGSAPEAASG